MTIKETCIVGSLVAAAVIAVAGSVANCAPTPPNVPVRTFQQAQKVDVVCEQVNDSNGNPLPQPIPTAENNCAPVPANGNGVTMPFHLYAVVTQTTPGAVAVVDLTAGNTLDVDRTTPGFDFIPVGQNPTDVVVTRDAQLTFVSSADPNKMAIYAIDNRQLLGNSTGTAPPPPLRLDTIMACALPQPPHALAVVPTSAADGGASGSYVLVAMLRASAGGPAAIATIDPSPFQHTVDPDAAPPGASFVTGGSLAPCTVLGATGLRGAPAGGQNVAPPGSSGPAWPDGIPYADAGDLRLQEPSPGPRCPSPGADAAATQDAGEPDAGEQDAGEQDAGEVDGAAQDAATGETATADAAETGTGLPPAVAHPTFMAMRSDIPILYVADDAVPVIHVIDLHDPTNPRELDPLQATSVTDPTRPVPVGGLAVSPTTHAPDYKTYLYAIDTRQGSLMVFDVTDPADPVRSPRTPLQRPHPELNPLAVPDRIAFSAPVATVAFARHDWPVQAPDTIHQYTGLLCNPNPNAHPDGGAFLDNGAYYRADQALVIQPTVTNGGTVQTFPTRLRGVFAFATLSNGNVMTIDVDDWDAPCRRPDPMAIGAVRDPARMFTLNGSFTGVTGVLDVPEPPASGPDDLDPYHAPLTYSSAIPESAAVTLEAFFPVSAPNRVRSNSLLRNDPLLGLHVPNVLGTPQLFNASGAPVVPSGAGGATSPILLATPLSPGFIDPTYIQNPTEPYPNEWTFSTAALESASGPGPIPSALFPGGSMRSPPGVRVSFDDPTAQQDQDWTITYEGALPTVSGIVANVASTLDPSGPGAYQTLTLAAPGAHFCARGIEDWTVGQSRAGTVLTAICDAYRSASTQPTPPSTLPQWTADYVEIEDDLLASTDPYWSIPGNECWGGPDNALGRDADRNIATTRYNACVQNFGATAATDADTHLSRDLPILHARDDSLEVGRFGWFNTDPSGPPNNLVPEQTTNRVVVAADPGNAPFLRLTRCCFHHQASFHVRTGGEWVAVGTGVGLLHHVTTDASGACVPSCDDRNVLMNARAFDIPWAQPPGSTTAPCTPAGLPTFDRNSPLAMRNPMFSFVVWSGCGPAAQQGYGDHTLSTRDLTWKFSMRGGFSPLTVPLTTASTGSAVSPQSMRYIGSLGQLAVVDGEAQGLLLIDLNLVAVVHSYF